MLFAVKYQRRAGWSDSESKRIRDLLMKWQAPEEAEIRHHYHYVSGGGVLIVETNAPASLFEGMEPFKALLEFDVEPVINFVEALAISTDVDEWAATASDATESAKAA